MILSFDILSDLIINDVTFVTKAYNEVGSGGKRVSRERWAIIHKFEGETIYTAGNRNYLSNCENLVILPKGSNYEWRCVKSGRFCVIEFEADLSSNEILYFTDVDADMVQRLFQRMETRHLLKEKFYKLKNLNDTYSLLVALLKGNPKQYSPSDKRAKIEPAVKFIAKNIAENPSNDFLASLCGISTVYMRKLFSEIYGDSPINYLHKLKISKAKEMLKSDFGSIGEIAFALGYPNLYDFSRDFKKHVGVAPRFYK